MTEEQQEHQGKKKPRRRGPPTKKTLWGILNRYATPGMNFTEACRRSGYRGQYIHDLKREERYGTRFAWFFEEKAKIEEARGIKEHPRRKLPDGRTVLDVSAVINPGGIGANGKSVEEWRRQIQADDLAEKVTHDLLGMIEQNPEILENVRQFLTSEQKGAETLLKALPNYRVRKQAQRIEVEERRTVTFEDPQHALRELRMLTERLAALEGEKQKRDRLLESYIDAEGREVE